MARNSRANRPPSYEEVVQSGNTETMKNKIFNTLNNASIELNTLKAYIAPYTERNSCTIKEGGIYSESYSLLNEKGVIDYIPKQSLYPSWVYNYIEILSLISPQNKNDLLNLLTFYDVARSNEELVKPTHYDANNKCFPRRWLVDNYISASLYNEYVCTAHEIQTTANPTNSTSSTTPLRSIVQHNTYENTIHPSSMIARPEVLDIEIGIAGDTLYTTQTTFQIGSFSAINQFTSLMTPNKDTVVKFISDILQSEPMYGIDVNGRTLGLQPVEDINNLIQLFRSTIKLLEDGEINLQSNYRDYMTLTSSKSNCNYIEEDSFLSYELYGYEGLLPTYILQRGDVLNSGIHVTLKGFLDTKKENMKQHMPYQYQKEILSKCNLPLGMSEPLFTLFRVQYESSGEADSVKNLHNKFVSMQGDLKGYFYIYNHLTCEVLRIYIDKISKYNFATCGYLLPPIYIWAYHLINNNKTSIKTYTSIDSFLEQNQYSIATKSVLSAQSSYIDVSNDYIDKYKNTIKTAPNEWVTAVVREYNLNKYSDIDLQIIKENILKTLVVLDKHHLTTSFALINLALEQGVKGEVLDMEILLNKDEDMPLDEFEKLLCHDYQFNFDYEEFIKEFL